MTEKTLITGGAGFIGTHLVDYLLKKGDEVVVLDNLSTGNRKNLPDGVRFVEGDIRDKSALSDALDGVTKVYHHAAELGVDRIMRMSDEAMNDVDFYGTKMVLEACRKSDVETLLFASSSEVYGNYLKEELPMCEDDAFVPDTAYGDAKRNAEILCQQFSEMYGIKAVCVRYFNVYGARQTLNGYAIPNFIHAALRNNTIKIHGDGKQIRDFTYIDDCVKMTTGVCQKKFDREVFNVGSGDYMNMIDLANKIISMCNSRSAIEFVKPRRDTDTHNKYSNNSKIVDLTGLDTMMEFGEGLKRTIAYYREQMKAEGAIVASHDVQYQQKVDRKAHLPVGQMMTTGKGVTTIGI
jgi:UDP-glucose 4-epimerase